MGLLLIFLFGALAISFLCSLLESVLMSTPISYISMKEEEGDRNAIVFSKLKDNPDRPLTAILSLNTIANTVGAAGVGQQATLLFGSHWFGVVSAVMTLLILIFSEIVPKTIGTYHWKSLTWLSHIMKGLMVILYPVVWLVEKIRRQVAGDEPDTTISREEVSAMANIGEEEGVIDNSENKVIQNIIKLDDIKAYDVMTPRVVAAIAPEYMTHPPAQHQAQDCRLPRGNLRRRHLAVPPEDQGPDRPHHRRLRLLPGHHHPRGHHRDHPGHGDHRRERHDHRHAAVREGTLAQAQEPVQADCPSGGRLRIRKLP